VLTLRISVTFAAAAMTACAATPPSTTPGQADAEASQVFAAADELEAESVLTVDVSVADAGEVCEEFDRPGSRIKRVYCWPREEYEAMVARREAEAEQYLATMEREQEMRDLARRDEAERRRNGSFGIE